MLELRFYLLLVQFLCTLLEYQFCTLTFFTYCRFLCETLHTAIIQEVGTKLSIVLQLRIEEINEMGTLRRVVNAESKLFGRVGSSGCHKINADVSVVAKIVTPVDVDSHIE